MGEGSLAALESAVARDLDILQYPSKPWMSETVGPAGEKAYDVLVVGAGHLASHVLGRIIRRQVHPV